MDIESANTDIVLSKLAGVYETVLGVDPEDFKLECIFGPPPDNMRRNNPKRKDYLGADEIEMLISMLHIEEAFNNTIDDTYFVPRREVAKADLWRNRPVGELVAFCVETLLKGK